MRGSLLFLMLLFFNSIFSQHPEYKVFNTSINSEYAELGATYLYSNTIIFASSKKVDDDKSFKKDRRRNNSQFHLEFYKGIITENGDIIENGKFSNDEKNKYYEADISFTPDLKTVFFTWNNYYSAETKEDIEKWNTLRIVKGSVTDTFQIGNIIFLPINSSAYSVRNPVVSRDGKKLFFVSDMAGGFGENDIYYIDILPDNTFGNPVNLGSNVNSKYNELYPTIDSNHNLYFSALAKDPKNGLDIYKSEFKNGSYEKAKALPEPINSEFDEFGFVLNSKTNSGFFTSNRTGSLGDVDIYAFTTGEKECVQSLTLNFIDANSKKQLTHISGALMAENKVIEKFDFKENLQFKTKLKCNTSYKIVATKNNYVPFETNLVTSEIFDASLDKTFELFQMDCTQNVDLLVTATTSNYPIENCVIQLISNGNLIDSKPYITGNPISFAINCNTSYEIIATANNFETSKLTFKSNTTFNAQTTQKIVLTPLKCTQIIAGTVTTTENIPLTGSIALIENGKIIEKLVSNTFRFNIKCNSNYKITVVANNFNEAQIDVTTDNTYNSVTEVLAVLIPKDCEQFIEGLIVNNTSISKPKNTIVSLFENGKFKEKQNLTNNNVYNFTINCNSNYMLIAEAENFETNQIEFTTNNEYNSKTTQNIELTPKVCNQIIAGIVKSNSEGYPLKNVVISLFSNNVLKEKQPITDSFKFNIDCNSNYSLVTEADNFETNKVDFSTSTDNKITVEQNISLTPKECSQKVELLVLNADNKLRVKNAKISLYLSNELIETKNITTENALVFNVNCNSNYKIMAEAENFDLNQIEFSTNNSYTAKTQHIIELSPKPCNQIVTGVVKSNSNTFTLKNAIVSLYLNGILKEQQAITDSYKFRIECNTDYSIVTEADNFETNRAAFKTTTEQNKTIEQPILLAPKACSQKVEIIVLNAENKVRITKAKVLLYIENNLVDTKNIVTNNALIFNLNCNSNYRIVTEAENFEINQIEFTTETAFNTSVTKSISLIPKPCNQQLLVNVINKENNEPLFGPLLSVFKNNKLIESFKLEGKNTINLNLECKNLYSLKIQLDKFDTQAVSFQTTNMYNDSLAKTIILTPSVEFVNVSGQKLINTNTIFFDLDNDKIRDDAAIELNKVVTYLTNFPNAKVDIKSHTDSRAPDNYNLELSNRRAISVVNYIIANGIDSSRVSGKGYGETELLNKCSNGVNCSELEHQINRRTEFVIIEN